MKELKFLVIEYVPHIMHHERMSPVRIDGHYETEKTATEVAQLWSKAPKHRETRIVVAQIVAEAKRPAHWPRCDHGT
ncbi:MAG: hypothetical protein ACPG4X_16765 [Pikeienuella sp.]